MNRGGYGGNRNARFGPPGAGARKSGGFNQRGGQNTFYQPNQDDFFNSPMGSQSGQQGRQPQLTPEQVAFEAEFSKWEKSFDDWKQAYANHPDRVAYREYEQKFLEVKDKLLIKRDQLFNRQRHDHQLETDLDVASAMADNILQKFGGEPSNQQHHHQQHQQQMFNRRPDYVDSREQWNNEPFQQQQQFGGFPRDGPQNFRNQHQPQQQQNFHNQHQQQQQQRNIPQMNRGNNNNNRGSNNNRGNNNSQMNRGNNNNPRNDKRPGNMFAQQPGTQYPSPWIPVNRNEDGEPPVGKRSKRISPKIQRAIENKQALRGQVVSTEPGRSCIASLYKEARSAAVGDLPQWKRLSGAKKRKSKSLRAKNPSELTPEERQFLEEVDTEKREHLEAMKKARAALANQQDEVTNETQSNASEEAMKMETAVAADAAPEQQSIE